MCYSGTDQSVLLEDVGMPLKDRQIIQAAEELFLGHRYHEVTLQQVADQAGVGKGTIYRYFRNKEDLYYRILLTALDELAESLEKVDTAANGSDLTDIVARIVEFYTRRRSLFALLQTEKIHCTAPPEYLEEQWQEKQQRMIALLATRMKCQMDSGSYRTDLKPEGAALLLLGMVRSALCHQDEMPEPDELSSTLVSLFECGIGTASIRQSAERGS